MKKNATKSHTVTHCNFTGVHSDASAVEAVKEVATGLRINAEALSKIADLLKSQNIKIESLLHLG